MTPAPDPVLRRVLAAAGLRATERFTAGAGWVSRVWVGEELVVRTSEGRFRDAYPELFASERLLDRLLFYEVFGDLALCAHHARSREREEARSRLSAALSGRSHLDRLTW